MQRLVKSAARLSLPVRYYMVIPAVRLINMFISHLIQMRSWPSSSVWSSLKSDGYRRNQAIVYIFARPSLELVPVSFQLSSCHIPSYPITMHQGLGVHHSDSATLFIILSPSGPYFRNGFHPISLLAISHLVRAWPGGTGAHKLGLNYAPTFMPQIHASSKGYDQILWLLEADCPSGEKELMITEVGAMNVFVVVKRDDGSEYGPLISNHVY